MRGALRSGSAAEIAGLGGSWSLSPKGARGLTRQSGVALVATLIMLSLVTFMVVAFLSVARRERQSVAASLTINEARSAMEAGLARAQADLATRLLTGDKWNYGLMGPTNFENLSGFAPGVISPTNVNSALANSTYFATPSVPNLNNYFLQNLANLQYDPRVPVFSPYFTNRTPYSLLASETNLGRYYLDFNRDGMFESTDNTQTGDPHWLGILEYPNAPHSATNHFTSRYTYLVAPAGKTLDLNFIHNQAKRLAGVTTEGYLRNLSIGPHEMNLAAMLAELNPFWTYNYNTGAGVSGTATPNDAFTNALHLLLFRNNNSYNSFATLATQFGASAAQNLTNAQFDVLGNGPLMTFAPLTIDVDPTNIEWQGGSNTSATAQRFFDLNELFMTTRGYSATLTSNLNRLGTNASATPTGDASRRAYYTLLSTLGVESWPVDGKLNLNWSNAPYVGTNITIGSSGGDVSGFADWNPNFFFFNAAELMLRATATPVVSTNPAWAGFPATDLFLTNHFFGGGLEFSYVNTYYTNVPVQTVLYAPGVGFITNTAGFVIVPNQTGGGGISLSVTNIPIFPFSYYSAEVHRLLQFTANLYDATTANNASPAYPTLFRPFFDFNTNGWPSNDFIRIVGYTTNGTHYSTNPAAPGLLELPLVDLSDPNSRMQMYTTPAGTLGASDLCHVTGAPVIVGAKKGYPNFNEYAMQTVFSLTRRLEFVKTNANSPGPMVSGATVTNRVTTNQSLIISLFNINAFEAWNSYAAAFPRPLLIVATNITRLVITNEFGPVFVTNFANTVSSNIPGTGPYAWQGIAGGNASFKSFLFTNTPHLALTNYSGGPNTYFPSTTVFIPSLPQGGLPGYAYATNYPPLSGLTNGAFTAAGQSSFNRADSNRFPDLRLGITITNSIMYALVDGDRVVDFVNLANLVSGMDLSAAISPTNANPAANDVGRFFATNRVGGGANPVNPTFGITNQIQQSTNNNLSYVTANLAEWTGFRGSARPPVAQVREEIERFRRFMGLPFDPSFPPNQFSSGTTNLQAPFTSTRVVALSTSWEANDPLVHHTTRDMEDVSRAPVASRIWAKPLAPVQVSLPPPGTIYSPGYTSAGANAANNYPVGMGVNPPLLGLNRAYMPWGRGLSTFGSSIIVSNTTPAAYDLRLKDPGVWGSDSWDFPQRKFANLGWIGRVHRGTPWQTFYLKSDAPNPTNWFFWARSTETMPTNDWRLVDIFSTAINADATRGLISVNQTNSVAWAAALSGTLVLSNNLALPFPRVIAPQTPQLTSIVGDLAGGLINAKQRVPMWQPVASYSAGDVVGYWFGPYGTRYSRALVGANQNFNPTNALYWTNVPYWNPASTYTVNDLVVHQGVSYYSMQLGNNNFGPHTNRVFWEPYLTRSFSKLGYVLSTPELSVRSPYLNMGTPYQFGIAYLAGARVYFDGWSYISLVNNNLNQIPQTGGIYWQPVVDALSDVLLERIPQQTLGLMQLEASPRVVIYANGQSLKPAERGVYVGGGPYQGMTTNYQITGEQASRSVVRIDGLPEPGLLPRPLPPGAPQVVFPRFIIESFKLIPADY